MPSENVRVRPVRSWLRWPRRALLVLAALAALLYGLLQTPVVKEAIRVRLARRLTAALGTEITLGRLRGHLPFAANIDGFTIGTASNMLVTGSDVTITWNPLDMLRGGWRLSSLRLQTLEIFDFPKIRSELAHESKTPGLPPWLSYAFVEEFEITEVFLRRWPRLATTPIHLEGRIHQSDDVTDPFALLETHATIGEDTQCDLRTVVRFSRPPDLQIDLLYVESGEALALAIVGRRDAATRTFSLSGKGAPADWQGKLSLSHEGSSLLGADVHVQMVDKQVIVSLDGTAEVIPSLFSVNFRPMVDTEHRFSARIRWLPPFEVHAERLSLECSSGSLQCVGDYNIKTQMVSCDFHAILNDLAGFQKEAGYPVAGKAVLSGTATGALRSPRIHVTAALGQPAFGAVHAGTVDVEMDANLIHPLASAPPVFQISGHGTAKDLYYKQHSAALPADSAFTFLIDAGRSGHVRLREFTFNNEYGGASFSGQLDPAAMASRLHGEITVTEIGEWTRGLKPAPRGALRLLAEIDSDLLRNVHDLKLEGELDGFAGLSTELLSLVGTTPSFSGHLVLHGDSQVEVTDSKVNMEVGVLGIRGVYDLQKNSVQATWQASLSSLERSSALLRLPVSGAIAAHGELSGTPVLLNATAEATSERLVFRGTEVAPLAARVEVQDVFGRCRGAGKLRFGVKNTDLGIAGSFERSGAIIDFPEFLFTLAGAECAGNLKYNPATRLFDGILLGRSENLVQMHDLLGIPVEGNVQMEVHLDSSNNVQNVSFHIIADNIDTDYGSLNQVELDTRISDMLGHAKVTLSARADDYRKDLVRLEHISGRADGSLEQIDLQLRVKGLYKKPFVLTTQGILREPTSACNVEINELEVQFGEILLGLLTKPRVEYDGEKVTLRDFQLALGDATIDVSGAYKKDEINGRVVVQNLPLSLAQTPGGFGVTGSLEGQVDFREEDHDVRAEATVHVSGFQPSLSGDLPKSDLDLSATLENETLAMNMALTGALEAPVRMYLQLPLELSLQNFKVRVPSDRVLAGEFGLRTRLEKVGQLLLSDTQRIEGDLESTVRLSGIVGTPVVEGDVFLRNGMYHNFVSNTALTDVFLHLRGSATRLELLEGHGRDGDTGVVNLAGWVELLPQKGFPFLLALDLSNVRLVDRDDMRAVLGGNLEFSTSGNHRTVKGELVLGPAEIRLPDRTTPPLAGLEIVESDGMGLERKEEVTDVMRYWGDMLLDVDVDMPARVSLRGRGLDVELRGNLHLGQTARQPKVEGKVSVQRGRFNFVGKTFLVTEGEVTFGGIWPPTPYISITSEARAKEIVVVAKIHGTVNDLRLDLEAIPALPTEEILSRLLFGTDVGNLTVGQGLQLGYALARLSGRSGTFDVFDWTRRKLGVDELSIAQKEDSLSESAITAGKYLRDDVYLKVEEDLGLESGSVSVEVMLTPRVSLEGAVSQTSEHGIRLNWKYDY